MSDVTIRVLSDITIRILMTDTRFFGNLFGGESWAPWRALLSAFDGLPLDEDELAIVQALTGLTEIPQEAMDELWLIIGRRGGKTLVAALKTIHETVFKDHASRLSPGEVATALIISADRKQARTAFRYVCGLLHSCPMLERLIVREDRESIELSNRTCIEIGTASFRSTRGYTLAFVVADEIAFWRNEESANPDSEIINALRPALASLNGRLMALSSPYSRKGELWEHYRRYFRQPGPILVAQAPSRTMNPLLPERVVKQAKERDLSAALAEYEAEFRSDICAFVDVEVLHQLTRSEPPILPPQSGIRYQGFVDPSGGGADGFALCIGHREPSGRIVVDLLTERTRINPATVTEEYAGILKQYNVREVTGDRYGAGWTVDSFRKQGIHYTPADLTRSELYLDCLQMLNSGQVELPPSEKLIRQFQSLERRTSRAGRDIVDHPLNLHDDLSNAVAGLCRVAAQGSRVFNVPIKWPA